MERAARLIRKNNSRQIISDDDIVRGIWPAAVGKAIAKHTRTLKVVRSTLVVEVEDAIWQRQLFPLGKQIVDRMQKMMGCTGIQDVEFRIGIAKRQMGREESLFLTGLKVHSVDEADEIQDPVLMKVYRLSRKRATA